MKKGILILFGAAFVLGLGFTSCKKDYTCTCTTSGGGASISASTTIHETKKKAKDACTAGTSTVVGITTTCEID